MKRRIFLFSLPILLLVWFFVLAQTAKAEYSLDLNYSCPANSGGFGRDYVFQKFKPKANTIQGFIAQKSGATQWYLCKGALDTNNLLNNKNCGNSAIVFQGIMQGEAMGGNYYKFILPQSYALEIGADYYFQTGGISYCFHYHNEHAVAMCGVNANGSDPHCAFNNQGGFEGAGLKTIVSGAEPALEPVILVPGIMGSYLYSSIDPGVEVWPAVGKTVLDPWDFHLNQLIMDEQGKPSNNSMIVPPQDIIRSVLDKDFFAGLIAELKQNGYVENETLFVFPYDWRLNLNWSASDVPYSGFDSLKDKVEKVKQLTGAQKVNIIAHSMGGLVAKNYIKHYGASSVGKFIDIGTPHLGAPEALKILMYGDNLGTYAINQDRIKTISQNFPSVYQLLPSQNYFNSASQDYSYYIYDMYDLDNNGIKNKLDYAQSIDFIKNTGRNNYLLGYNDALHNDLDNYSPKSDGIKTYNIMGCGSPTIGQIFVLNKEAAGTEYGLKYISGDGTVPLRSAEALTADDAYYVKNVQHSTLPSSDGIKQIAAAILKDTINSFPLQNYPAIASSSAKCSLTGTQISFHSPIELNVYDGSKHVGPIENGDIELGIEGARYDNLDGNKFVFLPAGHNYQVVGSSTASGSFNARVQTVQAGQYVETVYYNQVPLDSASTTVRLQITSGQTAGAIEIDQDGDKNFEATVQPSSILNEQGSADLTKPETAINILGIKGNDDWYISPVQISFTASDNEDGSGILKTEYSLDNGQTWQVYADIVNIDKQGTNKILFKSTDKAGNIEEEKILEFKIDSVMPNLNSSVIGTMGQNDWYISDVQISLSAEDGADGSGLDKIEYSTDNGGIWQSYDQAIVLHNDGKSNIFYRALDKAGNQADNKEIAIQIDRTPPTLEMIAPLANDEYDHAENLEILYNSIDSASGLNDLATKMQIDGQDINTAGIDLFLYELGEHHLTIEIADLAGNQTAITVPFSIITSIPGAINDIKRLYSEKQIIKASAKDELIRELNSLQKYLERFGKRQDKRLSKYQERLIKCDKRKKHADDCRESVKKLYERHEYILNKAHAKIVANRLAGLLKDLEKYYVKKWLTPKAYEMIKEELIYLKNNL